MTFRIDAVFDLASGEQPLSWGAEAVIQGYFSVDQGRVVVADVTAEIISWSTSEIRFTPIKSDLLDGPHPVHVDCVDIPYFAVVNNLTLAATNQTAAVVQDHDTIAASDLVSASQVQSVAIEIVSADVEYIHDFVTDDLGEWTFDRASVASAPDRNGTLRFYDSGEPAWYKNKGIQLEPAATNLLENSTDLTNETHWKYNNSATVQAYQDEIDGQQAFLIEGTLANAAIRAFNNVYSPAGEDYVTSFLTYRGVDSPDAYKIATALHDGTSFYPIGSSSFLRGPGTINSTGSLDRLQDLEVGWPSKYEAKYSAITGAAGYFYLYPADYNKNYYRNSVVACPQVEQGPHATSYIRTSGATVTRALATLDAPMGSLGALPAEGVTNDFAIQFEFMLGSDYADWAGYSNQAYLFELWGDASNFVQLRRYSATQLRVFWTKGGTNYHQTITLSDDTFGSLVDIRIKTSSTTGLKFWVNGIADTGDANTDAFAVPLTHVYLGNNNVGNRFASMVVGRWRFRTADLADAVIEAWDSCYTEYLHDFRHRDLDNWTYTRASEVTVPYNGKYHTLGVDVPPWKGEGLLLEYSRTNQYATDLHDPAHIVPDGALADQSDTHGVLDLLHVFEDDNVETQTNHFIRGSSGGSGYTADVDNALSTIIYKGELRFIIVQHMQAGVGVWAKIDTATWTITNSGAAANPGGTLTSFHIEPISAYSAKLTLIGQRDTTASFLPYLAGATPTGGTAGIFLYTGNRQLIGSVGEWQMEAQHPHGTSLIKTAGSTVTRAESNCHATFADLGFIPSGVSNDYCGQVIVVLNADFSDLTQYDRLFSFSAAGSITNAELGCFALDATNLRLNIRTPNETFVQHDASALKAGDICDIRFRKSATQGLTYWLNGVDGSVTNATALEPHGEPIQYISPGAQRTNYDAPCTIARIRIKSGDLSDAEIEAWPGLHDEYQHDFDRFDLGGFTFTRASEAWGTDCYGNVFDVAVDEPIYQKGTGLLLEAASTNCVSYSKTMESWSIRGNVTVTDSIGADGVSTAKRLVIDSTAGGTNDYRQVGQPDFTIGADVATSIYLLVHSGTAVDIHSPQSRVAGEWRVDMTVLPQGEWVRITAYHPAVTVSQAFIGHTNNYCGVDVSGVNANAEVIDIEICMPQQEDSQLFPTSYIETIDHTNVTRAETVCGGTFTELGMPVANVVDDICGQIVITLLSDFADIPSTTQFLYISSGIGAYSQNLSVHAFLDGDVRIFCGLVDFDRSVRVNAGGAVANDTLDIRFVKRSGGDLKMSINGGSLTGISDATSPFLNALSEIHFNESATPVGTHVVRRCKVLPYAASDAEIEAWPTWAEPPAPPALPVMHFAKAADLQAAGDIQSGAITQEVVPDWYEISFLQGDATGWTSDNPSVVNYDNGDGTVTQFATNTVPVGPRGALVEKPSTNYFNDSAGNSAWTGSAITATGRTDPAGTTKAIEVTLYSGSSLSQYGSYTGTTNSEKLAPSFWIRRLSGTVGNVQFYHNISPNGEWFLPAASIPTTWTRVDRTTSWITFNDEFETDNSFKSGFAFACTNDVGDAITIEIAFCQIEASLSHYATSYIETTDATPVTRGQSSIYGDYANLGSAVDGSNNVGDMAGHIVAELILPFDDLSGGSFFLISDGGNPDNGDKIEAFCNQASPDFIQMRSWVNWTWAVYRDFDHLTTPAGAVIDMRHRRDTTDGYSWWHDGVRLDHSDGSYDGSEKAPFIYPANRCWLGRWDYASADHEMCCYIRTVRLASKKLTIEEIEGWDAEYLHDFTTQSIGAWTHTRASEATAPDETGEIQTYSTDQPAWYGEQGLQLEASSTNLQDFSADHSSWTTSGTGGAPTIVAGDTDLGITAWQHTKAAVADSGCYSTFPDAGTADRSATIWCKPVTKNSDGSCFSVRFRDLGTGSASYQPTTVTIDGNGTSTWELNSGDWCLTVGGLDTGVWTKVTLFFDNISVFDDIRTYLYAGSRDTAEAASCHLAGPQWERGIATSYMPVTDSSSTTRAATDCKATFAELGLPLPAVGFANDFSLQIVFDLGALLTDMSGLSLLRLYNEAGGYNEDEVTLYANFSQIRCNKRIGGASQGDTTTSNQFTTLGEIDVRIKSESGVGFSIWMNGVKTSRTDGGFLNDWASNLDAIQLAHEDSSTGHTNVRVKKIRIRPEALTDEEIEAWT